MLPISTATRPLTRRPLRSLMADPYTRSSMAAALHMGPEGEFASPSGQIKEFPVNTLLFETSAGTATRTVVRTLVNAGYAGRDQNEVQAHIAELAKLGVAGPRVTPALYPVSPYLAQQSTRVDVQHHHTSGEAEWALIIVGPRPEDVLVTAACDHTDRDLEVHGVAWSKNASPDVLATRAWRLVDIADHMDGIRIIGRVGAARTVIQDSTLGALLSPHYWLDVLAERGDAATGTVLLSGTVAMHPDVDPFSDRWETELIDEVTGDSINCAYQVVVMPAAIG